MTVLNSVSGRDEDYHELPYKVPKQTLTQFIEDYYNDLLYANLEQCSNMPKFEKKFVPPFPKNVYIFDHCKLTGDGFPDILPVGYYKVFFVISGPVQLDFNLIVKLSAKFV